MPERWTGTEYDLWERIERHPYAPMAALGWGLVAGVIVWSVVWRVLR